MTMSMERKDTSMLTAKQSNYPTLRGIEVKRGWWALSLPLLLLACLTLWACGNSAPEEGHDHEHGEHDEHGHGEEKHAHKEQDDHGHDSHGEEGHEHGHEHGEEEGHSDEVTLTPEGIASAGIKSEPAQLHKLTNLLTVPARVSFNEEAMAHVGTSIPGRVAEIRVKLGDTVKQGDVLLVIDSPEFGEAQSEMLQKLAGVEVAKTRSDVTKVAYERAQKLADGKGISQSELLRREGEFKATAADRMAAESALLGANNKLKLLGISQAEGERLAKTGQINSRFTILAPLAGRVVEKEATLGEVVGPDSPPLLVLADMTSLWVLADVPEGEVHRIALGAPAQFTVPTLKDHMIEGKIAYLDSKINSGSRSAAVRIVVPGEGSPLQPGMFGQAEIEAKEEGMEAASALAVPAESVLTVEGGPAVFVPVEGEPNTFAKRSVRIGTRVGSWIPILSGIKEGELVVVAGTFTLKADLGKAGAAHVH